MTMYKPGLYVIANDPQRTDANDIFEEFSEELGEMSGCCLDIGSGSCDVVADFILPKLNPKASIVCSDISEPMMDFGREKYKDNNRMSFITLNIESLNLPEDLIEQFDHVTSFYCLHWCQDMGRVFGNIFNLLRPGGTTFLVFLANNPIRDAYPILAAMPSYQPYMKDVDRHIPVYRNCEQPLETVKALLKGVGFEVCHFSRREKSYVFKRPISLSDFLLAVNPFIERMPTALGEQYRQDLVKEVTKRCIIFNENDNQEEEYSILFGYNIFISYLKKPMSE